MKTSHYILGLLRRELEPHHSHSPFELMSASTVITAIIFGTAVLAFIIFATRRYLSKTRDRSSENAEDDDDLPASNSVPMGHVNPGESAAERTEETNHRGPPSNSTTDNTEEMSTCESEPTERGNDECWEES